jgi:LemA protein
MSLFWWIVMAVLAVIFFWAVGVYNRLMRLKNQVANAFGQIDVQLKRRYDLIPNLVEVARKYLQHEAETLEAVIAARNQAQSAEKGAAANPLNAGALGALAGAEQLLGGALGRLFAVVEDYPELKADQNMRELTEELTHTENRVGFARQAYNDQVLEYNDAALHFPTIIVARLLGFIALEVLASTANDEERKAPKVQF